MSSSIQNELGIIVPPADTRTRTIVESAARFISKKGLDFERKILDSNPKDARFKFLRSSADPCHAYYKHKLAEYLTQNQDDTDESAIKIVLAPENVTREAIIDIMARLVIKFGSEFKLMVIDSNKDDARFNFLSSPADHFHELYRKRLTLYRANPQDSYYKQKLIDYLVQIDQKGATTDVSYPMGATSRSQHLC
ncbi:putative splicing factor 3A subunit 1 [Cardamine amara subsp. amara]|uniref:Splicing factor 3A subunit 1 n=1 Tax=Cardamine amara subsp. amara TaxID=228776 RepID=A0ABD0ZPU8_CARAN